MEFISRELDMRTIEQYGGGISTAMDLYTLEEARQEVQVENQRKANNKSKTGMRR